MGQIHNGQASDLRPGTSKSRGQPSERETIAPSRVKETKLLAVLDSSEDDGKVVDYLVDLAGRGMRLNVVLLSVQPRPLAWQTRDGAGVALRNRLPAYRGKRVVRSAQRKLEPCGIAFTERIEFGMAVETIVRCARDENCDAIVVAAPRVGPARRWLAQKTRLTLGSVPAEIAQLATVPVVVVNGGIDDRERT